MVNIVRFEGDFNYNACHSLYNGKDPLVYMLKKINSLKQNQGFMKYFKNTSWLFFERIVKMGINFFVIILLTRYLGPENFGLLSYSQSLVGIFTAFATLGIDVILVRELTKNKESNDKLIGTAVILKFIASIIAMVIIFILNITMEDREAVLLTNIIAFTLLFQSISTIDTYFQAKVLSRFSAIVNTFAFVISAVIKLGLIFYEAQLVYFAYALVFDSILMATGYLYIYMKQKKSFFSLKYDSKIASYFFKNGWPLMLVSMAAFIYTRTDQIMIKHLVGNEAVGNYAAAIKVSELFYFIPLLITQSVFPKIIEVKLKSEKEYFTLLEKLHALLVWIAIPISLGLFVFSDSIVSILYGEKYVNAASILNILAFAIVLNAIGSITTKILYAEHYEKKYLYRSILGVFVNIGLNFWLINLYGARGAAMATLVTLFIIYYIYDLLDKDLHKFYYLKLSCLIPRSFKLRK